MEFEWDEHKAAANFAKHGISFELAMQVFADPMRIIGDDTRKDYGELRQNTVGRADADIIACVTHTDRAGVTRLISARHASRKERKTYYGQDNQNDA